MLKIFQRFIGSKTVLDSVERKQKFLEGKMNIEDRKRINNSNNNKYQDPQKVELVEYENVISDFLFVSPKK